MHWHLESSHDLTLKKTPFAENNDMTSEHFDLVLITTSANAT